VAYLVPEHPYHQLTRSLEDELHAVNPTVIHETYHTCVFKLKRRAEETSRTLVEYKDSSLCLALDSQTVEFGLTPALKYSLGGRDALILASYALAKQVRRVVTMDNSLLAVGELEMGRKKLRISSLSENERRVR
jgi:predicted nucleic acid-binding protein